MRSVSAKDFENSWLKVMLFVSSTNISLSCMFSFYHLFAVDNGAFAAWNTARFIGRETGTFTGVSLSWRVIVDILEISLKLLAINPITKCK